MSEVLVQHFDNHWSLKLNRPKKHNAFNPKMIQELTEFFRKADKDPSARYVLLSGAGPSFCAGADLEWMKSMAKFKMRENQEDATKLFEMFEAGMRCGLPIVTKVHGNVVGGGLGLLAISDIVVAEAATNFCFSETRLGLVPAVISSFILRKMKPNKARELMMTAQVFDVQVAWENGLVEYFGRELEVDNILERISQSLLVAGPEAVRESKKLFDFVMVNEFDEVKKQSVDVIAQRRMSDEGQEGMTSFFEKRRARWVVRGKKNGGLSGEEE